MGTITELLLCMCVYCSRMLGGLIFSSLCSNLMRNILEFEDSYVDVESYLQFITFFTAVYFPLAKAIMALPFSFFCLWIDARFNFSFFFHFDVPEMLHFFNLYFLVSLDFFAYF